VAGRTTDRAVVGLDAVTVDEFDRRLDRPVIPALVSATEVATILGVSRQRVEALADTRPDFPQPAAVVGAGKRQRLWVRDRIESWAKLDRPRGRHLNAG
jgi:hypothetical protein